MDNWRAEVVEIGNHLGVQLERLEYGGWYRKKTIEITGAGADIPYWFRPIETRIQKATAELYAYAKNIEAKERRIQGLNVLVALPESGEIAGPARELSQATVEKVQALYWVLHDPYNGGAGPYDWVFSQLEPYPVPNRQMHWRRPTFEECQYRQAAYDRNPAEFRRRAAEATGRLREYVRRAEWDAKNPGKLLSLAGAR